MSDRYTAAEMMTVTASRALSNGSTCFVGIGLPSEAGGAADCGILDPAAQALATHPGGVAVLRTCALRLTTM